MQAKQKIILASLVISILLMSVKFVAYFATHSNAILTDAAESIVNVLASAFAFYSIYLASQPKDKNHPYGHGKVEFFSAFVEGLLIVLAGLLIVAKSVYNIFYPQQLHAILDGVLLIGITGVVNGVLGLYLVKKGKRFRSITLSAEGKHLITDAISTFGLMLGLVVIYFTGVFVLDSLISIALGFYIIYSGYRLVRKSVSGLMDEVDTEVVGKVVQFLNSTRKDAWIDVHNLRAQRYGAETHIDCHVTLPYYLDLNQVHDEISEIDRSVGRNIGDKTEFFIHADPCIPQCCHYCSVKNCTVRSQPQTEIIAWTLDNITKNQKHFEK
ncbi:cation diffusion facilitator family transporter [Pedobacter arcticus]|uniref:cation diffusion facilitator family transporter n=1 Tax=Pedobacter arcticus TaxID=752140 RepID=UPI0004746CA7|nr:cation diffusion facilitator family transporter [Pedobacter arcticus]